MYIFIWQSLQLWEATNKKSQKRMERIIHQTLKQYNFRKLFQLNIFENSRIYETASCRQFSIEN